MCFVNLLSEAEELAGIYKMERTVTIQDIYPVLLVSADTELERSVKHSIYDLMIMSPTGVLFVEHFTLSNRRSLYVALGTSNHLWWPN